MALLCLSSPNQEALSEVQEGATHRPGHSATVVNRAPTGGKYEEDVRVMGPPLRKLPDRWERPRLKCTTTAQREKAVRVTQVSLEQMRGTILDLEGQSSPGGTDR